MTSGNADRRVWQLRNLTVIETLIRDHASRRGHLMPAGHDSASAPQHSTPAAAWPGTSAVARPAAATARRHPGDPATARLLATVDSESRPYTDPRAGYVRARDARQARTEGAFRRGRR